MARTRLSDDQAVHVTTLEDLLPLDAFATALVDGNGRPKLYGLATSSKVLRDMVSKFFCGNYMRIFCRHLFYLNTHTHVESTRPWPRQLGRAILVGNEH